MIPNDYHNSFVANKTAKEAFICLTQKIPQWWSSDFEGAAEKVGDEFVVRFGKSFKKFEVEHLEPHSKIVWRCLDQYIDAPEVTNQTEWLNTRVIWTIDAKDFSVKVGMHHDGLNTNASCYSICEKGWASFTASLFALVETGIGLPFTK